MAAAIKWDLPKSSLTFGISNFLYDRAVRYAEITGLQPGVDQYRVAGEAILAQHPGTGLGSPGSVPGYWHPVITNLALARINLWRWGPQKMMARLDYERRAGSQIPPQPAATIADFAPSTWASEWYQRPFDVDGDPSFDSRGLPDGTVVFINCPDAGSEITNDCVPVSWSLVQQAQVIQVPTVLSFNPASRVNGLRDKTNADSVTFGGLVFPPNTIRFDGLWTRWFRSSGQNFWACRYVFTAVREGFYAQSATVDPVWTFDTVDRYPRANFAGQFPVHA